MPMPDIPGMYYDEARRKYFKIIPSHQSIPSSSKYTRDSIQQSNYEAQKLQRHRQFQCDFACSHVKRARVLHAPTTRPLLRECAHWNRAAIEDAVDLEMGELEMVDVQSPNGLDMPMAVRGDYLLGVGFVGDNHGSIYSYHLGENTPPKQTCMFKAPKQRGITSLHMDSRAHVIWTDLSGIGFGSWGDPATIRTHYWTLSKHTVWQSATGENGSPERVALATSSGVIVPIGKDLSMEDLYDIESESEFLSVEWHTPVVLVGGCRNGKVMIHDTRAPRSAIERLKFPTSALQVRSIDANRLLVAGLKNHMHTYDLRFARCSPNEDTEPWLTYPSYEYRQHTNFGFDVSRELGLIALGDGTKGVQLMGLWNAMPVRAGWDRPVQEISGKFKVGPKKWDDHVRALAFARGDYQIPDGLVIAGDKNVEGWRFRNHLRDGDES